MLSVGNDETDGHGHRRDHKSAMPLLSAFATAQADFRLAACAPGCPSRRTVIGATKSGREVRTARR
jgi:hypothetical protein